MSKTTIIVTPGSQQIVMTRDFDAPIELVFRAYTDPELLKRWWGPAYLTSTVETMDVREGGSWRFVQRDPEGNEYAFRGVYHVVDAPHQVVQTNEFEGLLPERHVSLETITLEEHDGVTTSRTVAVFQTVEDRDGLVASGMESGFNESMERLTALLAEQV